MKIEFNNIEDPLLNKKKLKKKIFNVVDKKRFILGKEVNILENKLSNFVNSKYAITVSSGTDALLISLLSLNLKKNSEVITPSFSYISSAEVIVRAGLKPVFCDVDLSTALIDTKKVEKLINKNTSCIIVVSLFGQIPDVQNLIKIKKKYKIPIIEDGAQSFGSKYKNQKSCSIFNIGCTSFFPTKSLGCFGDGGSIFTNNKKIYLKAKQIRQHGQKKKYSFDINGLNARLDTIQAAVLLEKIKIFPSTINRKKKIFERYISLLKNEGNIKFLTIKKHYFSCYPSFNILAKKRNKLRNFLQKKNIPTIIYYPRPITDQKIFKDNKSRFYMKNSLKLSRNILSLPFHLSLKENQIKHIAKTIKKFYKKN